MLSSSYRPALKSLYGVGVLLTLAGVVDPLIKIWPLRMGEAGWRFGAVGMASGIVGAVVFALVWLLGVAMVLEHRRVVRVLSAFSLFLAVCTLGALVGFGLDFLQLRASVNPQFKGAFDVAALKAIVLLTISVPVFIGVAMGGWASARMPARKVRHVEDQRGLLVRAQTQGGVTL